MEVYDSAKFMGGLGFRDFELFNLALLARQSWRILQHPNSLCAQILKVVYFPQGSIFTAELGSRPSQVWRAILEGRDVLCQGLIRRIGDGTTTRIWTDNWIPRHATMRPLACLSANPPNLVSDLMDSTTATWNRRVLDQTFLAADTSAILSIPLCTRRMNDFWAWNFERNGNFTVRSAYRMLADTKRRREDWLEGNAGSSNYEAEAKSWTSLWSVQVPGKIRNFLWRLAKHAIPTEDVRHTRKMTDDDKCQLCGMQDSWRHSLLQCSLARCVWALVDEDVADYIQASTEPNARLWLFAVINDLPHASMIKLVVTLWAIWAARRKAIHEGVLQSPHATHSFVTSFISELESLKAPANVVQTATNTRTGSRGKDTWIAPSMGVAKIHVDGGLARNGRSGASATVCRDHTGLFLGSSAMVFGDISDPATLEALACREALALAMDLSLDQVIIACDNKTVVAEIKNGTEGQYSAIIKEICARARGFRSCEYIFEGRALNIDAHNLVKFSTSLDVGRHLWLGVPHDQFVIPVNRSATS